MHSWENSWESLGIPHKSDAFLGNSWEFLWNSFGIPWGFLRNSYDFLWNSWEFLWKSIGGIPRSSSGIPLVFLLQGLANCTFLQFLQIASSCNLQILANSSKLLQRPASLCSLQLSAHSCDLQNPARPCRVPRNPQDISGSPGAPRPRPSRRGGPPAGGRQVGPPAEVQGAWEFIRHPGPGGQNA